MLIDFRLSIHRLTDKSGPTTKCKFRSNKNLHKPKVKRVAFVKKEDKTPRVEVGKGGGRCIKVLCVTDGKVHKSIFDTEKFYGIPEGTLRRKMLNNRPWRCMRFVTVES